MKLKYSVIAMVIGLSTVAVAQNVEAVKEFFAPIIYNVSSLSEDYQAGSIVFDAYDGKFKGRNLGAAGSTGWVELSPAANVRPVRFTSNANGSIANNTIVYVDFEDVGVDDGAYVLGEGSGHTTSQGSGWRYVVPSTGVYAVNSVLTLDASGNWENGEVIDLRVYKNSTIIAVGFYRAFTYGSGITTQAQVSTTVYATAGDVIQIGVVQDSDAALTMQADSARNYVDIYKID